MTALRTIRSMLPMFVLACLLAGIAGFGTVYYLAERPPVRIESMRELDGLAVKDGTIDIAFTLTRNRDCEARVDRWMWQDTGTRDRQGEIVKKWVFLQAGPNPPTPLGVETSYVLSIPLPANVTPGTWYYWARTYDGCQVVPALDHPSRESKNIPVVVTAYPKPDAPRAPELTTSATPDQP